MVFRLGVDKSFWYSNLPPKAAPFGRLKCAWPVIDWIDALMFGFDILTRIWGDRERSKILEPVWTSFAVRSVKPSFRHPSPTSAVLTWGPPTPFVTEKEKIFLKLSTGWRISL